MTRRIYPVGIQSFEKIRTGGYLYIDKTRFLYDMVHEGTYYFLSRPRRFGKSLLVNTLKCYFEGKRELFEGLAIAELETEWTQYPVMWFDFSGGKYETREQLEEYISYTLGELEQQYGLSQKELHINQRFANVVRAAHEKTGRQVVVLIDEYDAPMLFHIENETGQDNIRIAMRNLFSPLKSLDDHLRFVFFTGITKFSQMSVFSELNNLNNISMLPQYDVICGISEEELTTVMRLDIERLAEAEGVTYNEMLDELKREFDGYHFSRAMTDVYNPFSLMSTLNNLYIKDYWFESGTPSFLIKMLRKNRLQDFSLEGVTCAADRFDKPVERIDDPTPVLYQSGYLTIKNYQHIGRMYTLGFPNLEVRRGFFNSLLDYTVPQTINSRGFLYRAYLDLWQGGDSAPFVEALKAFYASIPYQLEGQGKVDEHYYHSLLYALLMAFGAEVKAEPSSNRGRADLVLLMPQSIYIMEIKLDATATEALRQIDQQGYAKPYLADGRKVVKVGINFDSKERNIVEWEEVLQ